MERKILINAVRSAPDRRADGVEAVDDLADLRGVARSAASPAASISIPVRNSITSSTARSGDSRSNAIRSGGRAFSGTKAPTP